MVILRMRVLLLYFRMFFMACSMPEQKGKHDTDEITLNCMICNLRCVFLILQTQHSLNKLLDWENSHLYHKLGLHWRLAKQRCDSSSMMEYVSMETKYIIFPTFD